MESAQVRIRPFRFAFLVEPKDKKALQRVFEMTSSLWGGIFNYIIPLFKQVPDRYKQEYQKPISAKTMIHNGLNVFHTISYRARHLIVQIAVCAATSLQLPGSGVL
jgi:hypothetical protein